MPKLLIVDDEEMIRAGLSQMVPRLLPEWEVAGACPDAESAWQTIQRVEPDLVILDIGMPGESGLVLADRLSRLKPDISIIMLTGYDRFEDIHSALRSGVSAYLLKPIQRDELKQAIVKVGEKIAGRTSQSNRLLVQALTEWVLTAEGPALRTLIDILDREGLRGQEISYNLQLTMFVQHDNGSTDKNLEERHARAGEIVKAMSRSGSEILKWAVVPIAKSCELLFVAGRRLICPSSAISGNTESGMLAAAGDPVTDPAELPRLFREVQERLLRSGTEADSLTPEELERLSRLTLALEMNDLDGTVAVLRHEIQAWRSMEPLQKLRAGFRLIAFFSGPETRKLQSKLLKRMQPEIDKLTSRLLFNPDPVLLQLEVEILPDKLAGLQPFAPDDRKVIAKVKEIIKREFMNPNFTLEQAAAGVYLNPTYLSELFKESTGQKFIDYITEVRLNEARRMLMETDMKMYEVCDSVGYTSSKYFSTLFRKRFDVTPTQYRESSGDRQSVSTDSE